MEYDFRNNPGAIYNRLAELANVKPKYFINLSSKNQRLVRRAFVKSVRQHKSRFQAVGVAFTKIHGIKA